MRIRRKRSKQKPQATLAALLAALCLAFGLAACGEDTPPAGPAPDYEQALAGAPAPLAELYAEGNELLEGGKEAYEQRVSELNEAGFPVVVNAWASWCGPCITEIPHFQEVSARLGKEVAFLGINPDDSNDAAGTFLRDHPLPYPSYVDPDKKIFTSLGAIGLPATVFYDRQGRSFTRQGYYRSEADLEADIRRHALREQS